jgi:nicotinamidase-related amidase
VESWLKAGKPVSLSAEGVLTGSFPEEFCVDNEDYIVVKPRFSAFFGTEPDALLRRLGVDTLLMAGTTTPNCIRTTAYDAIALEYNVAVARDCTSSATEEIQRVNLEDMARIGVQLMDSKDFISGKAQIYDSLAHAREILKSK